MIRNVVPVNSRVVAWVLFVSITALLFWNQNRLHERAVDRVHVEERARVAQVAAAAKRQDRRDRIDVCDARNDSRKSIYTIIEALAREDDGKIDADELRVVALTMRVLPQVPDCRKEGG